MVITKRFYFFEVTVSMVCYVGIQFCELYLEQSSPFHFLCAKQWSGICNIYLKDKWYLYGEYGCQTSVVFSCKFNSASNETNQVNEKAFCIFLYHSVNTLLVSVSTLFPCLVSPSSLWSPQWLFYNIILCLEVNCTFVHV